MQGRLLPRRVDPDGAQDSDEVVVRERGEDGAAVGQGQAGTRRGIPEEAGQFEFEQRVSRVIAASWNV